MAQTFFCPKMGTSAPSRCWYAKTSTGDEKGVYLEPKFEMTIDLIRNDLSLKGSSHKIADKQIPGHMIAY